VSPLVSHFDYRNQELHAESVSLTQIAERYGTPCYVYSRAAIERSKGLEPRTARFAQRAQSSAIAPVALVQSHFSMTRVASPPHC